MISETDMRCVWMTLHWLSGTLWWIVFLLSFAVIILLYKRTRGRFLIFFLAGNAILLMAALPNTIYPQGEERPVQIGALIEIMRSVCTLLYIIGGLVCIRWFIRTEKALSNGITYTQSDIRKSIMKWTTVAIVSFLIVVTGWYFWPEVKVSLLDLPAYEPDVLSKFGLEVIPYPPLPPEARSAGYCATSRNLGFYRVLTLGFDPSRAKIQDESNCVSYVVSAEIEYYSLEPLSRQSEPPKVSPEDSR